MGAEGMSICQLKPNEFLVPKLPLNTNTASGFRSPFSKGRWGDLKLLGYPNITLNGQTARLSFCETSAATLWAT